MAEPAPLGKMRLSVTTQDALKGLGLESITDVPHEFRCAICLNPVFGGVALLCEHLFHKTCLEASFTNNRRCPTCRKDVQRKLKPMGRVLANLLERYTVRCPQGCGEAVAWGRLQAHVKDDCPHTLFACAHEGCDKEPSPRDQAVAHAGVCEEAVLTCTCGASIKRKDMQAHLNTDCPNADIICDHCGQSAIKRGAMENHLRQDCKAAATIPLVKPLMDEIKALQEKTKKLETQLCQEKGKIRRLAQELRTSSGEEWQERTRKLETQLCQEKSKTRRLTQELRTFSGETNVSIYLPTRICDLPVETQGFFQKAIRGTWLVRIYPKGSGPSRQDSVSFFLGAGKDTSQEGLKVEWEVQIGEVRKEKTEYLGIAAFNPQGIHFDRREVQHQTVVDLTVGVPSRMEFVDL